MDIHELVKSEAELDSIARILLSEISKDNQSISRMNILSFDKAVFIGGKELHELNRHQNINKEDIFESDYSQTM